MRVALEHYRRSNPRGVISLYDSYRKHFKNVPDIFMGLDVKSFLARMHETLRPVVDVSPLPEKVPSPSIPRRFQRSRCTTTLSRPVKPRNTAARRDPDHSRRRLKSRPVPARTERHSRANLSPNASFTL